MYCKTCGKEIHDNAVICPNCGCATNNKPVNQTSGESKKTMGILLGLFLGLIGLIIGIAMFPNETEERATFLKGWTIGFVITIAVSILFSIIYGVALGSALY